MLRLPVISFLAGATLLGAGVLAAAELASACGTVLVGGSFLGVLLRS